MSQDKPIKQPPELGRMFCMRAGIGTGLGLLVCVLQIPLARAAGRFYWARHPHVRRPWQHRSTRSDPSGLLCRPSDPRRGLGDLPCFCGAQHTAGARSQGTLRDARPVGQGRARRRIAAGRAAVDRGIGPASTTYRRSPANCRAWRSRRAGARTDRHGVARIIHDTRTPSRNISAPCAAAARAFASSPAHDMAASSRRRAAPLAGAQYCACATLPATGWSSPASPTGIAVPARRSRRSVLSSRKRRCRSGCATPMTS